MAEAIEKSNYELKAEFVYFCVCEKKKNSNIEIILKVYKKCKFPIQKGF